MDAFRDCVSDPRLLRYENTFSTDREAIARYCWNIELAESLLPSLSILEVTLRNAIHGALTAHTGTEFWFQSVLHPEKRRNIDDLVARITRRIGAAPTSDKIVSEITFGFWVSLFAHRYHALWWQPREPLLAQVFPYHPKIARDTRKHLEMNLEYAVALRNRTMHHEAVFQGAVALNRPRRPVDEIHHEIRLLIAWMSPVADIMVEELDRFAQVFAGYPDERVARSVGRLF
jgi:hypothetical protein